MVKITKKIFVIITLIAIFTLTPKCYATNVGDIIDKGDLFVNTGKSNATNVISEDSIKNTSDLVYSVLLTIGIIVAVVWGMILGINFITGAIEEKADVKKALIPYLVGCVIIFGAFGIWKLVVDIMQQIS